VSCNFILLEPVTEDFTIGLYFNFPEESETLDVTTGTNPSPQFSLYKQNQKNADNKLHAAAVDVSEYLTDSLFRQSRGFSRYDSLDTTNSGIYWSKREKEIRKYFYIESCVDIRYDTSETHTETTLSGVKGLNWIVAVVEENDSIRYHGFSTIKAISGATVVDTLEMVRYSQ